MTSAVHQNVAQTYFVDPAVLDVSDDAGSVLDRLLVDLLDSILLTATTASVTHWLRKNRHVGAGPDQAMDVRDLSDTLRDYQNRLDLLRRLTTGFHEPSGQRAAIVENVRDELYEAWRQLADAGLAALEEIGCHVSDDTLSRSEASHRQLCAALAANPVDASAVSTAGDLRKANVQVERRKTQRARVNLHAYIIAHESIQKVAVFDASKFGLGVLGLKSLPLGTRVQVLLNQGRSITGQIAWNKPGCAGIQLNEPLPDCSEILSWPVSAGR